MKLFGKFSCNEFDAETVNINTTETFEVVVSDVASINTLSANEAIINGPTTVNGSAYITSVNTLLVHSGDNPLQIGRYEANPSVAIKASDGTSVTIGDGVDIVSQEGGSISVWSGVEITGNTAIDGDLSVSASVNTLLVHSGDNPLQIGRYEANPSVAIKASDGTSVTIGDGVDIVSQEGGSISVWSGIEFTGNTAIDGDLSVNGDIYGNITDVTFSDLTVNDLLVNGTVNTEHIYGNNRMVIHTDGDMSISTSDGTSIGMTDTIVINTAQTDFSTGQVRVSGTEGFTVNYSANVLGDLTVNGSAYITSVNTLLVHSGDNPLQIGRYEANPSVAIKASDGTSVTIGDGVDIVSQEGGSISVWSGVEITGNTAIDGDLSVSASVNTLLVHSGDNPLQIGRYEANPSVAIKASDGTSVTIGDGVDIVSQEGGSISVWSGIEFTGNTAIDGDLSVSASVNTDYIHGVTETGNYIDLDYNNERRIRVFADQGVAIETGDATFTFGDSMATTGVIECEQLIADTLVHTPTITSYVGNVDVYSSSANGTTTIGKNGTDTSVDLLSSDGTVISMADAIYLGSQEGGELTVVDGLRTPSTLYIGGDILGTIPEKSIEIGSVNTRLIHSEDEPLQIGSGDVPLITVSSTVITFNADEININAEGGQAEIAVSADQVNMGANLIVAGRCTVNYSANVLGDLTVNGTIANTPRIHQSAGLTGSAVYTVNHNLGNAYPQVTVYSNNEVIGAGISSNGVNTTVISMNEASTIIATFIG